MGIGELRAGGCLGTPVILGQGLDFYSCDDSVDSFVQLWVAIGWRMEEKAGYHLPPKRLDTCRQENEIYLLAFKMGSRDNNLESNFPLDGLQ